MAHPAKAALLYRYFRVLEPFALYRCSFKFCSREVNTEAGMDALFRHIEDYHLEEWQRLDRLPKPKAMRASA